MPINTGGYQVQQMPTYSPLDPNRVTYGLDGVASGIQSSLNIANILANQKAFQQAQAELAATREGRLGAMNAQNLATIQLAPEKNLADIALAQNTAALAPSNRNAALAQNNDQLANLALKDSLRGWTDDTAAIQAQVANAVAGKKGQLDVIQTDNALENAPLQNKYTVAKLVQDFNALDSDKSMSDSQKLANIRNTIAEADAREAAARKADRDEKKPVDPIKELDDIQMQIDRLKKEPVINPGADNKGTPMPYIQYLGQTRAPDGSVARQSASQIFHPSTWGTTTPVPLNPAVETVANQLAVLEARLHGYGFYGGHKTQC